MKNSLESNFSVNVGLSANDLFELKNVVINFLKIKAERIITLNQNGTKSSVITLKKPYKVGGPTQEELIDLLKFVKNANDPENDVNRDVTIVTLSLPVF
jgi:hypothetical protein